MEVVQRTIKEFCTLSLHFPLFHSPALEFKYLNCLIYLLYKAKVILGDRWHACMCAQVHLSTKQTEGGMKEK